MKRDGGGERRKSQESPRRCIAPSIPCNLPVECLNSFELLFQWTNLNKMNVYYGISGSLQIRLFFIRSSFFIRIFLQVAASNKTFTPTVTNIGYQMPWNIAGSICLFCPPCLNDIPEGFFSTCQTFPTITYCYSKLCKMLHNMARTLVLNWTLALHYKWSVCAAPDVLPYILHHIWDGLGRSFKVMRKFWEKVWSKDLAWFWKTLFL